LISERDQGPPLDEGVSRTAKSCGPGAATLASSRVVSPTSATVAKQAAHRGEHV